MIKEGQQFILTWGDGDNGTTEGPVLKATRTIDLTDLKEQYINATRADIKCGKIAWYECSEVHFIQWLIDHTYAEYVPNIEYFDLGDDFSSEI